MSELVSQKENVILPDDVPSTPCKEQVGPETSSICKERKWSRVLLEVPAEGRAPSRREFSGSTLHYATGTRGLSPNAPKIFLKIYFVVAISLILTPLSTSAAVRLAEPNTTALSSGLVGYWSMDGSSINWTSNTMRDLSGNGNTGTLVSMSTTTSPIPGEIGGALKFNGSTNYMTVPDSTPLNVAGSLTIAAWIKPSVVGIDQKVLGKQDASNGYKMTLYSDNKIELELDKSGVATNIRGNAGGVALAAGKWYFVVCTYSSSSSLITCYVNGVFDRSGSTGASPLGSSSGVALELGAAVKDGAGNHFNGAIDDARVYNRALSAQEIALLYALGTVHTGNVIPTNSSFNFGLTNGLIGYWPLDGNTTNWRTNTTSDMSGSGRTGTFVSMSTSSSPVAGVIGQALKINGSSSYVDTGSLTLPAAISLCAWIKPLAVPSSFKFYIGSDNASGNSGVVIANNSSNFFYIAIKNGFQSSNATLVANKWYYICGTGNTSSGTPLLYVNGVLNSAGTAGAVTGGTNGGNLYIGNTPRGNLAFIPNAIIDDVRLYSRILSTQEISQLYVAGQVNVAHSNTTSGTGINSGLVGYWTFDGPSINWRANTVSDMSGNGNIGTLVGMSTSSSPTAGKIGQALSFNGVNSYVDLGNNSSLKPSLPVTVSAWIKLNNRSNYYNIVDTDAQVSNYSGVNFSIIQSTGQVSIEYGDGGFGPAHRRSDISVGTIAADKWFHVVGIIRGATDMSLYINGAEAGDTYSGSGGAIAYTSSHAKIGDNSWGDSYFPGIIDDVRVYNRALSAQEVQQLYQMGR